MSPQRIRLRRTKGWRKPDGAIVVARPSKWGNPFVVGEWITPDDPRWEWLVTPDDPPSLTLAGFARVRLMRETAVKVYGWWLIQQPDLMLALHELTGHDLACWCRVDQACHADVLLDLANESSPVQASRETQR
jgi:hypothetical protein